jgi:hypothetical protein
MNLKVVSLTASAVAAFTMPALAHHSFSMFDAQQTITLEGTVKEFEWVNPHAWLRVIVKDKNTGQPASRRCSQAGRRSFAPMPATKTNEV